MKSFALQFFKTNASLSNYIRSTSNLQNVQSRRAAIRIAVIDDQPFLPQMILQNYGYNVVQIGDLKNVAEVEIFI